MLTLKIFMIVFIITLIMLTTTLVTLFKSKNDKNKLLITLTTLPYTLICILLFFTSGELMDAYIFTDNSLLFILFSLIIILQLAILILYYLKKNKAYNK